MYLYSRIWSYDLFFLEWKMTKTMLDNQSNQPIGIEYEIMCCCGSIAYYCVHTSYLISSLNDIQIGVYFTEIMLTKLSANMLND
ncbi:Os11g0265100 [Oryza sativa Japonica Group]|uniref:Os11g0265100 protein n=1 Tax=Oryza sativa subsp. japonica TaxID=39947 RepID=A0A0P0Y116_ORYSJ|nr:hypothetical protein EE612_054628 [Oryza sativa]BAT13526.1 Os11g0265100 [Oryza sativa Japonica Group]